MDSSFVGMGFESCPICGAEHGESVLVHTRLQNIPQRSCTGFGLCPDCAGKAGEYCALVAVGNTPKTDKLQPSNARRTGEVAWVRRTVLADILTMRIPQETPFVYTDPEVIHKLRSMLPPTEGGGT